MPRLGQPSVRGDQVVNVVVDFPTRLSNKEKELLEKLRQVSGRQGGGRRAWGSHRGGG